jgi:trehalose-6-phosphate synthase
VRKALSAAGVAEETASLRKEFGDTRMILSVERLDFTKGILEKLQAYERLLTEHPELCGNTTLVTVCVPAASGMGIYDELQSQIEQTVGRINGRFGRIDWTPLQFFFRALPFEKLVVYYSIADVMWITPLRDGLNLVSKEFMAVQGLTDGEGVLVLSEFAGAAAELRGPILTNPHDPSDLVNTCYQALNMNSEEARSRVAESFGAIQYYDLKRWSKDFMAAVERSAP